MRLETCFFEQAKRTPDRWALAVNQQRWRYHELAEQVERRSQELQQMGLLAGDIVCVQLPNGFAWIRDAYAVMKLGAILMPVHPDIGDMEQEKLFSTIAPNWLISPSQQCLRVSNHTFPLPLTRAQQRSDLLLIGYTSGSTGAPKGFVKSHLSWTCSLDGWSEAFDLTEDDRVMVPLHMSYSAQSYPAFQALGIGAEVILLETFTPARFFQAEATCVSITPALIDPLIRFASQRDEFRERMAKTVISVGNKLTIAQRRSFEHCFAGSQLFEYYGSSEMGYATLLTPTDAKLAPETVGHPFPGVDVEFFDQEGKRVAPETAGKLFVRSPQAFEGYIGAKEQTQQSFIGDWVTSHDIGVRRTDGRIQLLGRDRDVIKSGGSLVYASEVEEALLGICGVKEAAVFSLPDESRGEIVCAVIVLEEDATLPQVQERSREKIAAHKRPRQWVIYRQLPRKHNGKIDKKAIEEDVRGRR